MHPDCLGFRLNEVEMLVSGADTQASPRLKILLGFPLHCFLSRVSYHLCDHIQWSTSKLVLERFALECEVTIEYLTGEMNCWCQMVFLFHCFYFFLFVVAAQMTLLQNVCVSYSIRNAWNLLWNLCCTKPLSSGWEGKIRFLYLANVDCIVKEKPVKIGTFSEYPVPKGPTVSVLLNALILLFTHK
jgi:hypothetical protein